MAGKTIGSLKKSSDEKTTKIVHPILAGKSKTTKDGCKPIYTPIIIDGDKEQTLFPDNFLSVYYPPICKIADDGL